jgi:hypothetical protein
LERAVRLAPVDIIVADRGYDSEQNHIMTEDLGIPRTIIRPRYENLQVYKTKGFHRKNMKRRFNWDTYHQRSKAETIFSVIKRMLGECVMSRYILTQNRETMYKVIAYNCYRITRNYGMILGWFLHSQSPYQYQMELLDHVEFPCYTQALLMVQSLDDQTILCFLTYQHNNVKAIAWQTRIEVWN